MKAMSFWFACLALVLGAMLSLPTFAQETPPAPPAGGGQGGGGPGGRGGDWRQQMESRLKERLGATDEEWKALQPKIEKVSTARRELMFGGMRGMFGGRGGRRGGDNTGTTNAQPAQPEQPTSPLAKANKDLQTVLDTKDAKPEEIKAKLTALRDAKAKAQEGLKAAQKELTEVLTQRQEAVLVQMGMID